MYPHRQLNLWTMGFIISPFLSPFMMGFIVARIRCVIICSRAWRSSDSVVAAGAGHTELARYTAPSSSVSLPSSAKRREFCSHLHLELNLMRISPDCSTASSRTLVPSPCPSLVSGIASKPWLASRVFVCRNTATVGTMLSLLASMSSGVHTSLPSYFSRYGSRSL